MIMYKYAQFISQGEGEAFDEILEAGQPTPHSGIYRCEGCGKEATSILGHALPADGHHQHSSMQGAIRWQLAVWG